MAALFVEAFGLVAETKESLALFISVANTNGEPVAGLTQSAFTVDTLSGTLDFANPMIRFLAPKPGFYMFLVPISLPSETDAAYVVSIVVAHPLPAGGTDNGQTLTAIQG